jgi:NADH:ubiquinone oxidoreductase subunit H
MFFKEDWIPPFADKLVFVLAPTIVFITMLTGFAVIPFAPGVGIIDFNFGLLYFLALSSLSVYSVVLAGYASNNKYSLLGGLRAAAQTVSYEVFMGISIMGVVMLSGTFNLRLSRRSGMAGSSSLNFLALLSFSLLLLPRAVERPLICLKPNKSWWPAFIRSIPG